MYQKEGYKNEFEFIDYLNGKKICELSPLFRDLLDDLFVISDVNSTIKAYKPGNYVKPDVCIEINGIKKYLSLKIGSRNSLHVEHISTFIKFLKKIGIKQKYINEYLKYHYADGTLDGSGKIRLNVNEYKEKNQKRINRVNKKFNKKEVIKAAINRFIVTGTSEKLYKVDAVVYGKYNEFLYITTKDLYNIVSKKKYTSSSIHFAFMFCQPWSRILNYNEKTEEKRHFVQLKWYSLFDEIIKNMNNKNCIEKIK